MAYKFNDEDKEVKEFKDSIPFGVHKVQFGGAIADQTEAGKDFIEIAVVTEDGLEDTARLWFTGGASNISFNTAMQIAVHQGKDDEEKAKIREAVEKVNDNQELTDVLNKYCVSGELWFTKYWDPKRTYEAQDGSTRQSINKNVYGYEPKLKPDLLVGKLDKSAPLGGTDITGTDAAAGIPKDDDWAK